MAWYRCGGGGGSGKDRPIYKTLKIHSGKINIRDGTIESDDTYYYTDAVPFSSDITFDMGLAQTGLNYDGIALYDSSDVWVDFFAATQRYRNITYSGNATICRLSFRASNLHYIMFHDWINNIMYSTEEVVRITDDEDVPLGTKTITENGTYSAQDDGVDGYSEVTVDVKEYVDLSSFALYYRRNTTEPTVTHISSTEVSFSFQDQNSSGYELCSFRLPLETGIYVAEIRATVDKNTGLNNSYGWGIYSSRSDDGASLNNNTPYEYRVIGNYVAFDKSDTAEHYYEVPINIVWNAAENNGYVCFTTAADNGVNATITVSSLKIRKV